jgi:DNA-binding phage protein
MIYIASVIDKLITRVLTMMTVEEIKLHLADANLKRVAERAGIHPSTVYRFVNPDSKPSYGTVKLLSDYLENRTWQT